MVKTLGTQEKCSDKLPFAMLFAVEPAINSKNRNFQDYKLMSKYNERFDVKTESYSGLFNSGYNVTIRDNKTGKKYHASGSTPESARDMAWAKVPSKDRP